MKITHTTGKTLKHSNMNDKQKVAERARDMVRSLIEEGYRKRFQVMLPRSCFYSLRHKSNGSTITIVGNYESCLIKLTRDGKIRHTEQVK